MRSASPNAAPASASPTRMLQSRFGSGGTALMRVSSLSITTESQSRSSQSHTAVGIDVHAVDRSREHVAPDVGDAADVAGHAMEIGERLEQVDEERARPARRVEDDERRQLAPEQRGVARVDGIPVQRGASPTCSGRPVPRRVERASAVSATCATSACGV